MLRCGAIERAARDFYCVKSHLRGDPGTQSIERAAGVVLRELSCARLGWRLIDIAERCSLDPGTASRILSCLVRERFAVKRRSDRHYLPGPALYELGHALPEMVAFEALCRPALARLAARTRCVAFLYLRSDTDFVCVARAGEASIKGLSIEVGTRRALCLSAGGRRDAGRAAGRGARRGAGREPAAHAQSARPARAGRRAHDPALRSARRRRQPGRRGAAHHFACGGHPRPGRRAVRVPRGERSFSSCCRGTASKRPCSPSNAKPGPSKPRRGPRWRIWGSSGSRSGGLRKVLEHVRARLVVHLRLECMPVLQAERDLRGRPRGDLVVQALHVGNRSQAPSPRMNGSMRAQPHTSMSTMV